MRVGGPQVLQDAFADHVVRWRGDVCDAAYPVTGGTNAAEGGQPGAGTGGGQKDQGRAVIPVRRKTSLARRFPKKMCTPGTCAAWNFSPTAVRRPRRRSCR